MTERKKETTIFGVIIFAIIALIAGFVINKNLGKVTQSATDGIDIDNGDTKINWAKYQTFEIELSESIEIKESGIYHLTGKIEDGMVTVDVGDENGVAKLLLNGVEINNNSGPAIYIKSADDVVIEIASETKNILVSGETFGDFGSDNVDGTIYSKGDLSFSGSGKLYVESNYQDAIVSKDDLVIRAGEIEIKAADDAIRGKDSVQIAGGKIKITSAQDGIKSTNEDDKTKGFVLIEDGEIEISAVDDGIHATTSLAITGGKIDILTSYEGLEGAKVTIDGGEINILALDDGINVAGGNDSSAVVRPGAQEFSSDVSYVLTINDGKIYVNATGDGLDSNGYIYINGGEVVVDGPINSANGALDSENGIILNGGSVVAVGASGMAEGFDSTSAVNSVSIYFTSSQTKGTKVSLIDDSGAEIFSHTSAKAFNHAVIGTEKLETGKTYKILLNGEEYESFVVENTVTTVGRASGMGPQGTRQPANR